MIELQADGHGDLLQVHADERSADIQPGIGTNALHGDRIAEGVVSGRGERTARLRLRDDIHNVCAGDGLALDDDGAVQMLAALRGASSATPFLQEPACRTWHSRCAPCRCFLLLYGYISSIIT